MPVEIRRAHTRIQFDHGGGERWSVEDPAYPRVSEELQELTALKLYYARGLASTLLYLINDCPTTALAQEKLALIRRALRTVPSPYEDSDG